MRAQQWWRVKALILTVLILLVSACQTAGYAPVSERVQPPSKKLLRHRVAADENLWVIAWRYEVDLQLLAGVNGLAAPYTLFAGQILSLDTSQPIKSAYGRSPSANAGSKTSTPKVYAVPSSTPLTVSVPLTNSQQQQKATPAKSPLPMAKWQWGWPAMGRVVKEYDASKVQKGISIYANAGTSVKAAGPGVVVYAGKGLRAYGNLLIVKHNESYLSAYAHNESLLVEENERVTQGQKIAIVGADHRQQNRLYFEIRKNGKPVNPQRFLPRL